MPNRLRLPTVRSVGYRVKSHVATRFRQWATRHLREFIIKGFVLDDERLKEAEAGWKSETCLMFRKTHYGFDRLSLRYWCFKQMK